MSDAFGPGQGHATHEPELAVVAETDTLFRAVCTCQLLRAPLRLARSHALADYEDHRRAVHDTPASGSIEEVQVPAK